VVEGGKASGQSRTNAAPQDRQKSLPSSPTVTSKVATDLGISDVTVRNRIKNTYTS
jgi:hypothetical protein